MLSNTEQVQILYEILMSVDSESDLQSSLKNSLSIVLRKLNCSAGGIFTLKCTPDLNVYIDELISIPRNSGQISIFESAKSRAEDLFNAMGWKTLMLNLPIYQDCGTDGCYHILSLSNFGFIILIKSNGCLLPGFVKSLEPVFIKVGNIFTSMLKKEELLMSEERLRSIYDNVSIGLYRVSVSGMVLMMNPAGRKILGIPDEDEIGYYNMISFYQFPSDRYKLLQKLEKEKNAKELRVNWKRLSGEAFPVNLNVHAFNGESGEIAYFEGSFEDITERLRFENHLKVAKENAERSEKLKSDFLAQMSHEIRTPINTIMNFTSLLKMDLEPSFESEMEFAFIAIENGANRLLRTIDLILNSSEIENGTYKEYIEPIYFEKEILHPIYQEFTSAAKKKGLTLHLEKNCGSDLKISGDKYTLTQIVVNLVDNAIKYTERGEVVIRLILKDSECTLEISDTGRGIAEEYLPFLFDKFTQEEAGYTRKFEGTGLGLALVKQYCQINNADISVKSRKGKGTTFILKIGLHN